MQLSFSLVTLLSLASVTVSSAVPVQVQSLPSSCKAEERVLIETHNVTAAGHEFQVSTKACSNNVPTSPALGKRVTLNACIAESLSFSCVTGGGAGPLAADCNTLQTAIVAAFEQPGQATLFSVAPQTAQEFTLGTCLWAWINENPVGGATLEYCFSELTGQLGPVIDSGCIVPGDTGGFVVPSATGVDPQALDWVFEVLHS
ncbi:hypothetical protein C8R47DRAFT_1159855 [Mycena vitilis]|nr:hypothetical protein C8R47DRAFT_1159855 [Mycena vitilis]